MSIPDYELLFSIRDAKKKISVMTVFSNALTDAAARAQAAALAPIIQELTGGIVAKVVVGVRILTNPAIPTNGSDVEEKALFTFVDVFGFPLQISIPAFLETAILPGTKNVDLSDEAVIDFVNHMKNATVVSSHDDDLTEIVSAVKTWA